MSVRGVPTTQIVCLVPVHLVVVRNIYREGKRSRGYGSRGAKRAWRTHAPRRDKPRQVATPKSIIPYAWYHLVPPIISSRAIARISLRWHCQFHFQPIPYLGKVIDQKFRLPSNTITIVRATSIFPIPFHFRSVFDHDVSRRGTKNPGERDRSISLLRIWSRKRFPPRVNATSIHTHTHANYRRPINVLRVRKTSLRAPVSNQPKACS